MLNLKSVKTQLILYLICFAVFLEIKDNDPQFLFAGLTAIISALAIESSILYLKTKRFLITESSVITGAIIGYVVQAMRRGGGLFLRHHWRLFPST